MNDETTLSFGGASVTYVGTEMSSMQASVMSVSALQALLAIDAAGLSSAYEAWAKSPVRTFAERAFIDKALFWRRDDPTLVSAAASLGLTDEEVDALFAAASSM